MRPWDEIQPEHCSCVIDGDHGIKIKLVKASQCLGSWAYPLQSLSVAWHPMLESSPSCTVADVKDSLSLHSVIQHNKNEFLRRAEELSKECAEDIDSLPTAFAAAVVQQMSQLPCGPLGQIALVFPGQIMPCCENLRSIQHIHSVKALMEKAQEFFRIDVATVLDSDIASLPLYMKILITFLSGLSAVEQMNYERGLDYLQKINACVGFGSGQYAAAVFAGVLSLEKVFTLISSFSDATTEGLGLSVVKSLHETEISNPRIILYSGSDAKPYEERSAIASALTWVVMDNFDDQEFLEDIYFALMQQGVAEFIDPFNFLVRNQLP